MHTLVILSSLVACISVLALWGLAQSLVQLVFFALVFGGFASGFISLWAGMGKTFGEESAQMIFSILSFSRGVGNIISGPISSSLLRGLPEHQSGYYHHRHAYGNHKYAWVVLFVGICMACSALLGALGFLTGGQKNQDGNERELTEKGKETSSSES